MQEAVLEIETMMPPHLVLAREPVDLQDLLACRDRVYCLCLGFAGNAADARDLAQETFAKALSHYEADRPENPQAWIMRIARNTCLDQARRRKSRGPLHPISEWTAVDGRTPESEAGREEEIAIVRRAIAALPGRLREVLVMREYGELAYQEIALALDLSAGTVMSRLNRARRAVLKFYREEHHEKTN
ncbi:MAG: RNA polymerase sigma factor [Acidobacteria bacterium]|nr:RNA polymerase sigma factor [Acidobacteriota bacterium]